MNPVISLDVSKGESHAQAFADRGMPYGKTFLSSTMSRDLRPFSVLLKT